MVAVHDYRTKTFNSGSCFCGDENLQLSLYYTSMKAVCNAQVKSHVI